MAHLSKKKNEFWGDIKSLHSAKVRFTFTHVYTLTSKLKIVNSIIWVRVYFTFYIYKNI